MANAKKNYNPREMNPDFIVSIYADNISRPIQGKMNQEVAYGLTSEWSAMMEGALPMIGDITQLISRTSFGKALDIQGITGEIHSLSIKTHKGTGYLEIPMQVEFVTYDDPYQDIVEPIERLHQVIIPATGKSVIIANNYVTVMYGNFFVLTRCVLTNLDIIWSREKTYSEAKEKAYPTFAQATFTVTTTHKVVRGGGIADINSMILK